MDITTFGSIAGIGLLITLTVGLLKVFGEMKGRWTQMVTVAVSFVWVAVFKLAEFGDFGKLSIVEAVIAAIVVAATAIGIHQVKTGGQ